MEEEKVTKVVNAEKNETKERAKTKEQLRAQQKLADKKNTFTLIYILVGLFAFAVLAMLIYAFIVTR